MKSKSALTDNKELVSLRKRAMKNGGYSLNLDYMIDGVRTRESLKLYLVPERNKLDKARNNETLKMAKAVQARRALEIQSARTGIRYGHRKDMLLSDYLAEQEDAYRERGKPSYSVIIHGIRKHLLAYGGRPTLLTVDKEYVLGFVSFMRKKGLSEGSVHVYFANLNTLFNNAYREGLMNENPIKRIETSKKPSDPKTVREYLTLAELRSLISAKCRRETVKKAFLFACFTGLRLSDIEKLEWIHIRDNGEGLQVETRMQKTGSLVYVPLPANAVAQLPERTEGKVFDLPRRTQIREALREWMKEAGIQKHITFHCSRHTYATILLTYGADIYTVSSLLGHANISTTQIYAKIVDESKRRTVNLIPDISVGKDRP